MAGLGPSRAARRTASPPPIPGPLRLSPDHALGHPTTSRPCVTPRTPPDLSSVCDNGELLSRSAPETRGQAGAIPSCSADGKSASHPGTAPLVPRPRPRPPHHLPPLRHTESTCPRWVAPESSLSDRYREPAGAAGGPCRAQRSEARVGLSVRRATRTPGSPRLCRGVRQPAAAQRSPRPGRPLPVDGAEPRGADWSRLSLT